MDNTLIQSIYEQNKNHVYAYLLSLTHNTPLSEDLTSEVFLSAIKSLPAFKGNSSIKTWLFSIARHKWYDHLRKSKKEIIPLDLLEFYLSDNTDLESIVISKELVLRIYEMLDQEPDINKAVVLMRIEGYSYFEIAQRYGISESSARVLNFRTKSRIRTILLKEGYTSE